MIIIVVMIHRNVAIWILHFDGSKSILQFHNKKNNEKLELENKRKYYLSLVLVFVKEFFILPCNKDEGTDVFKFSLVLSR